MKHIDEKKSFVCVGKYLAYAQLRIPTQGQNCALVDIKVQELQRVVIALRICSLHLLSAILCSRRA